MSGATPSALLAARLAADPAGPLLTYYDAATGERTELSAVSTANWVAKTAGLLAESGVGEGSVVATVLPVHWQHVVILFGAWRLGAAVELRAAAPADRAGADLLAVAEEELPVSGPGEVLAVALRPLARGLARTWPGVTDYAAEVLAQPDRVDLPEPDPAAAALRDGSRVWTGRQLADAAREPALPAGARVLTGAQRWDGAAGLVASVLGPLAAGGSCVLARGYPGEELDRIATMERVTATAAR